MRPRLFHATTLWTAWSNRQCLRLVIIETRDGCHQMLLNIKANWRVLVIVVIAIGLHSSVDVCSVKRLVLTRSGSAASGSPACPSWLILRAADVASLPGASIIM